MDEPAAANDVASAHAAGRITRTEALRRLGGLGLGAAGAAAFLTAFSDDAAGASEGGGKTFRILSFCGGGIRGTISAQLLVRLAAKFPDIISKADLLAGCSIGATSIISGIVSGATPQQILEGLTTRQAEFLLNNPGTNPSAPAYDVNEVAQLQRQAHGDTRLRDIRQKVAIVSFNVGSKNTPWRPLLFNNLPKSKNADTTIVDAVVSSGCEPGQFGTWKGNVDGTFFNHDPTIAAIALAVNEGVKLENIVNITFGTGLMPNWIASDTSTWGAEQWQNGDKNPANNIPAPLVNGTTSPALSVFFSGTSTDIIPNLVKMLLPRRYSNLNPELDRFIPENAASQENLDYMIQRANQFDVRPALSLLKKYW